MKVFLPGRIVNRHVGGNTTYARELRSGLQARGVDIGYIPSAGHPVTTLLRESSFNLRKRPGSVVHFTADTGMLVRGVNPTALTVHGVASRWITTSRTRTQEAVWRGRVRRAIASSDRLLSVSETGADDVAAVFGYPRDQITVIPHGIAVDRFREPAELSAATADQVPSRYALYVGNVEPRKNLVELVAAFQTSEVLALGLPLVIAGRQAWNVEESMEAIRNAQNVTYLGFVSDSDRVALMQHCEVFLFPSLYEGFGLPVLEAMAAGARVVCSDRGALKEFSGPSMVTEDTTGDAIADAIVRAVTDTGWRASYPAEADAWVSRFRWDDSITSHLAVYRELCR